MGRKRIKGEGALHDEQKKQAGMWLTPTAIASLDELAEELGTSRSEVVEQYARSVLALKKSRHDSVSCLQTVELILSAQEAITLENAIANVTLFVSGKLPEQAKVALINGSASRELRQVHNKLLCSLKASGNHTS